MSVPAPVKQTPASPTPGPWQCYADLPSVEPNWHIVTNASRMRVLANVHIEPGNAMDEANARLITEAPMMLAALKALIEDYEAASGDAPEDEPTALRLARETVARAEAQS